MDQCDTKTNRIKYIRSVNYILWSSDIASYLEDYLMKKYCILDNRSMWHKDRPRKIYVGILHGLLILSNILISCHGLKLFLFFLFIYIYIFQEMAPAGGICAPTGTCSSWLCCSLEIFTLFSSIPIIIILKLAFEGSVSYLSHHHEKTCFAICEQQRDINKERKNKQFSKSVPWSTEVKIQIHSAKVLIGHLENSKFWLK